MIKEKFIKVKGHPRNKKYYTDKGYIIEVGKYTDVETIDLSKGSTVKVTSICDNCEKESLNVFKDYWNYTNGLKDPYYCNKCKVIKSKKTSLDNWGVDNPMKSDLIKSKLIESIKLKYGVDWYSKTDDWLVKFKETSLKRYGVDNPSKNDIIKGDIRSKNIDFLKSDSFQRKSKQKKQRNTYRKYEKEISSDYKVIKYNNSIFTISHSCCGKDFTITKGLLYNRLKQNKIICTNCNPINVQSSSFELEIGAFLDQLSIDYKKNDRKLLNGLELDYFIHDKKIAIECNGVYWHNELFKSNDYHLNKTKMCSEKGVKLLHIWEDDWTLRSDIIKSIIKNKLNVTQNKIYARKCIINEVKTRDYKKFLEDNHIQGYASSSYRIGLYYKNELVSLMTFGWRKTNGKREYELIRFCNKKDCNVIGGASKLFKYFIRNNDVDKIISYADISIFDGKLYENLGFIKKTLSKPNYFWVVNGIRRHRYNYSKKKLIQKGHDPNKTEVEIMNDLGYWRVFSTGQEKWIYQRKTFL